MRTCRWWMVLVTGMGMIGVEGCTHSHCNSCGHQPLFPNAPWNKSYQTRPAAGLITAPGTPAPTQPMPLGPETTLTPLPGAPFSTTPGTISPGGTVPQPPSPPAETRFYQPPADTDWHPPTNGSARLAVPESAPPGSARDYVQLNQPEASPGQSKPGVIEERSSKPAVTEDRSVPAVREDRSSKPGAAEGRSPKPAGDMPVGIPGFALAQEGVTTGLRPSYLDGFDWLAAHGYRAVLHLRQPNDAVSSADRKQVEKYRMRYLSLEVTPQNLKESLDQFNSIVGDSANLPLFVYDKDGMLSGSLWYLHFRTVDRLADDKAKAKAIPLGLQVEQTESNRPMWLAIQKVLEQSR